MKNTPLVRLAIMFGSLPLAYLAAWATGNEWAAVIVVAAGVTLSISLRVIHHLR